MIRILIFSIALFIKLPLVMAAEQRTSVDFANILLYAQLSSAIYENESSVQSIANKYKFDFSRISEIPKAEIVYSLLTNHLLKQHIITIRGTANIENAMADMDIKLQDEKITGVHLHQGFLNAATPIYLELKDNIKTDYEITTTGHSLGGAVALIVAMQFHSDNFKNIKVVTFGQPKVTNLAGANKFRDLDVIRVVTPKDLVPMVPLLNSLKLENIDIYSHFGIEVILMGNNKYAELTGNHSLLRNLDFITSAPNVENLENHKMTEYLNLIKNNSVTVTKVTYKSSFNPLSFFGSDQ